MVSLQEQIENYYKSKPDFVALSQRATDNSNPTEETDAKSTEIKMPVHPKEENVTGSIYDQVAKESSDSTASSHKLHDEDTNATSGGSAKASVNDHKGNPGPVIAENLGEPESKEELRKRAAELNK